MNDIKIEFVKKLEAIKKMQHELRTRFKKALDDLYIEQRKEMKALRAKRETLWAEYRHDMRLRRCYASAVKKQKSKTEVVKKPAVDDPLLDNATQAISDAEATLLMNADIDAIERN